MISDPSKTFCNIFKRWKHNCIDDVARSPISELSNNQCQSFEEIHCMLKLIGFDDGFKSTNRVPEENIINNKHEVDKLCKTSRYIRGTVGPVPKELLGRMRAELKNLGYKLNAFRPGKKHDKKIYGLEIDPK